MLVRFVGLFRRERHETEMNEELRAFFTLEECTSGRDRVVVLTETYWRANYNADVHALGAQITINGEPHTIVGVAPRALEALKRDVVLLGPSPGRASE